MQTAAMRTRSSSKSGNSNNSKGEYPHSGAQIRQRAIAADNNYNTARSAAENVQRQGRPRSIIIIGGWQLVSLIKS